jgi:hypothetical protein
MPQAAPRACRCGAIVPAGKRCTKCTKAFDQRRGSARSRGYDAEWKRFRADFLKLNPRCSRPGCQALATDVDHIKALRDGGRRLDPNNCRSMCHRHHSQRTARDQVHWRT